MRTVVVLAVLVLLLGVTVSPATPVTERNKALVRRYVAQVLNAKRIDALDELLAPNYKRYLSPTAPPLIPQGQKQRMAANLAAFPDTIVTIDALIAEDDRVVFGYTVRGPHLGPLLGIAPTGKQVTFYAFEIVRFENGKYVEHWGGPDTWQCSSSWASKCRFHRVLSLMQTT